VNRCCHCDHAESINFLEVREMNEKLNRQRRRLMQFAGIGFVAAAAHPKFLFAGSSRVGDRPTANFHPDVEIELKQEVVRIPVFNGPGTRVWKIYGKVLK